MIGAVIRTWHNYHVFRQVMPRKSAARMCWRLLRVRYARQMDFFAVLFLACITTFVVGYILTK